MYFYFTYEPPVVKFFNVKFYFAAREVSHVNAFRVIVCPMRKLHTQKRLFLQPVARSREHYLNVRYFAIVECAEESLLRGRYLYFETIAWYLINTHISSIIAEFQANFRTRVAFYHG